MSSWILEMVFTQIVGSVPVVGIVVALTVAGVGLCVLRGWKAMATGIAAVGMGLTLYLSGINSHVYICNQRIAAYEAKLQALEDAEKARQAEVNRLRDELAEANAKASEAASEERVKIVHQVETKVIRDVQERVVQGKCVDGWSDAEFDQLHRLTRPRRSRSGN